MQSKWLPPLGLFLTLLLMLGLGWTAVAAEGDAKEGAEIYKAERCGSCHGKMGAGDGRVLTRLKKKTVNWTDKDAMAELSNEYLSTIIQKGGKATGKDTLMGPYPSLGETEIKDLIAFIRSLAK